MQQLSAPSTSTCCFISFMLEKYVPAVRNGDYKRWKHFRNSSSPAGCIKPSKEWRVCAFQAAATGSVHIADCPSVWESSIYCHLVISPQSYLYPITQQKLQKVRFKINNIVWWAIICGIVSIWWLLITLVVFYNHSLGMLMPHNRA